MNLTDNPIVGIIFIKEFENGEIQWDSSYESLDEFFEVMNVVAEEAQDPSFEVHRVH